MSDRATDFTGSIPQFYDHGLGPVFFTDFADDKSGPEKAANELAGGTSGKDEC